ncbi:MAG: hypothetical protein ACQESR_24760, partial [Planctomycetota bacterium]
MVHGEGVPPGELESWPVGVRVLLDRGEVIFQAVGFFRVQSCPTQAVLPLVGLAAEKVIRD